MTSNRLDTLRWFRLSAELVNIRSSPAQKAHPISVFQAIVKGVNSTMGEGEDAPVFFHLRGKNHTFDMRQGDRVTLDVFFCRFDEAFVMEWRERFIIYLADPETGKNFDILTIGKAEERSLAALAAETGPLPVNGEICLEFLTPFPFRPEKGKPRTHLSPQAFVNAIETRLARLFGDRPVSQYPVEEFTLVSCYWNYTEYRRASQSQPGQTQYVNGCAGKLYLKGEFAGLIPWLLLVSELHVGGKLPQSQGYFTIRTEPAGYFRGIFPNRKGLLSSVRDVLSRYDHALESLSMTEQYPFSEERFADDLLRQIVEDAYLPAPNTAFSIRKEGGTERLVENLSFRDLIVQHYLLNLISKPFDRLFEEGSIGFRRGVSRLDAVTMVQLAVADGYGYVIESDIQDFFPTVNLRILEQLLDRYIPQADTLFKIVLKKLIRAGYVLKGGLHERIRGLAQGSPLSPILANLYLDSFDERMMENGARMVRYADDFIILTKTREEAEKVLCGTEECLSELGLRLNKEKTAIRTIREGIRFLGIAFENSESAVASDQGQQLFKKPLYVTEPYLYLAISDDALEIRRKTAVIETIPLRRISEIMVMETAVFSTAVVRKCADHNIPLTISLNTGYYIATVKPDSKRYYSLSYEHAQRHHSLSDTEKLCIAKEFAAGKLANYIALFRQRYAKERSSFVAELERITRSIRQAASVEQVRGHEGAAARKVYQRLNELIDNAPFRLKKRERRNPDRINSLLNLGYYLLFSRINATVRAIGLNPYLGFLHAPEDDYESLVCDIEELFRPRIDRFIIRLVNLKIVTEEDFVETGKGHYLTHEAMKKFLNHYEGEMEKQGAKNELSLKEHIHAQVNVMKRFFTEKGELAFYEWHV
jgi:CRISPR-associated protein Cas1